MIELAAWQKIALYVLLLITIFIFVKTSQIKINNRPLIKLKYRIALAAFFPIIFVGAIIISSIIIGVIIALAALIMLSSYSIRKMKRLRKKVAIRKF